MPASPSRAETSPSCITPAPDRLGSSSCSASTPPQSRWYWSALRRIAARWTGLPSSVKPSAPASASSAISVSASPASPRVTEARKPTGMRASRRAASRSERRTVASSTDRVGVGHRDDGDEAAGGRRAGAGVEVLLVLLAGHAQVHVRVDEAGQQVAALALDHLGALGRLEAAGRAELRDLAVAHEHVVRRVDPGARVEHVGGADQHVGGRLLAVHERLGGARHVGAGGVHAVTS